MSSVSSCVCVRVCVCVQHNKCTAVHDIVMMIGCDDNNDENEDDDQGVMKKWAVVKLVISNDDDHADVDGDAECKTDSICKQ